jgi:hypothetical protein
MVDHKTKFDDCESQAGLSQFSDTIEGATPDGKTQGSVLPIKAVSQHVLGRSLLKTRARCNGDLAFLGEP